MGDAVVLVHHVDDRHARDGAGVEGLAAGSRIEGGAVEVDGASVGGAVHDAGVEIAQVGVGVIEAFGHVFPVILAE